MRALRFSLCSFVLTCCLPLTRAGAASPPDSTAYDRWYRALRNAAPDPSRGAEVRGLVLTRDVARIELDEGILHLFEPVDGRTFGAVFVGRGRFHFAPPIEVERAQLKRIYEADSLATDIRTAVLFFTDSTLEELTRSVNWERRPPASNAGREVEEALKYVSDDDGWVSRNLLLPFLNAAPGFFYAHVAESRGDPLIFMVNPYREEEISLSRKAREVRGEVREVVSQFHQRADYETGTSEPQAALDLVHAHHFDIESTIESNLDFSARARIIVQHLDPDQRWVPFSLYSDLEIDSIQWADGTPAEFVRPEESSDLWIDFRDAPADSTALTVYYRGELFERFRSLWIEIRSTTRWYPVYAGGRRATHRLTFHAPEKYSVVAVGSLVEEQTEDDVTTTVWETPLVRLVTFNLGEFEDYESADPRVPNLRVQVAEDAHRRLRNMAADANVTLLQQRDMGNQVTADIANSFAFFNDVFGPTRVNEFIATEIPSNHGEAYPGLVLLAWGTFQWTAKGGFDEIFRAHEVAHQWWGVGVQPATYHDRWLSEGFSDFAGLWYMGRARGSLELFTERLKATREAILDRRDDAGPIWLGTRVSTSDHPDDYETLVYQKGAWVVHMLRGLLMDVETGSDERFTNVMREFYNRHVGRAATTEQFREVVEQVTGADFGWFFNQWVYGSAIPTYIFSYKLAELENGEYRATVRVRQEDVPDEFQMLVPILLDFGVAGSALIKIAVAGPVTETVLPILPMHPRDIVFNPHEAVLAETKTEGWR